MGLIQKQWKGNLQESQPLQPTFDLRSPYPEFFMSIRLHLSLFSFYRWTCPFYIMVSGYSEIQAMECSRRSVNLGSSPFGSLLNFFFCENISRLLLRFCTYGKRGGGGAKWCIFNMNVFCQILDQWWLRLYETSVVTLCFFCFFC